VPPDDGARPPHEALRQRLRWLLLGRLLVATVLLGGSLLLEDMPADSFTSSALSGLIAAIFALTVVLAIGLRQTADPSSLAGVQLALDLALVSGLVWLTGGAASGLTSLYGVLILAAALVVGPNATQRLTAASLLVFTLLSLTLANGWLPAPPDAPPGSFRLGPEALSLGLLRNLVGLVMVGWLAGALAERLDRTGGRLVEAQDRAADAVQQTDDIVRSLTSGLITADLEGRVRSVNPEGASLLGGSVASLEGRPVDELLDLYGEAVEGRQKEGEGRRVDTGEAFPVGYSRAPLRSATGDELGTLFLFTDLSEIEALREKAERAERLAALGRLAAGLAHEIRNPLGSIHGSVELVREAEELSAEDRRLLDLVLSEVDRLNDLVGTMLDVGRPRAPAPETVDLGRAVEEVVEMARARRRASVILSVPEAPVLVHADPGQLRQLVWNLVKNALQFSPKDAEVEVEVTPDPDGRASLAVTDHGPGIAPDVQARLFDMFFSRRQHGVGLGLALVKQIVQAHGGTIEVESTPGEGATFRVRLPAPRA
jgi:two-component system sensor histidine kinase PilS (NtrC family)